VKLTTKHGQVGGPSGLGVMGRPRDRRMRVQAGRKARE